MSGIPLILQLDISGTPHQWIDYEKAAYYHCKDLIVCPLGTNEITLTGGVNRITGNVTKLGINSIILVKGNINPRAYKHAPPLTNKVLFRRDGNICAYCGNTFSPKVLTRDHVFPRALGGKDIWSNVVTSCKPCNNGKGHKHPIDDTYKLKYQPHVPSKAEYMILKNIYILDDQFDFLAKQVGKKSRVAELYSTPPPPEKLEGLLL